MKDQESTKLNTSEEVTWSAEDLKIQNNILNFQSKIKNNSFKNGETITADSTIWYLEALLNFNYSNPDSSFVNLTVDTTFEFQLPVNNDMVDFSNVSDAAFAMEEHILNYLNNMPNSIKFMIAADVKFKANELKNGSKTITITSGYGSEYIDNPAAYTPFGENDYWKYGGGWVNQGGYCDGPNQGQDLNSDAAEQIQYKINHPNVMNIWPSSYFTDVVSVIDNRWDGWGDYEYYISDYPNLNDDYPNDGFLDFLTLSVNWFGHCLEPLEMNFYLQGNLDIIESERQKLISNSGINYQFMYTDLHGMAFLGGGLTVISAKTTYGNRHIGNQTQ